MPVTPDPSRDIELARSRFVDGLKANRKPRIEDYLLLVSDKQRDALLRELLKVEILHRRNLGENPELRNYLDRFPTDRGLVQAAFRSDSSTELPALPTPPDGDTPRIRLVTLEGPNQGQVVTLEGRDVFVVGRSKQSNLQVHDELLSRTHFMIEVNAPACRLMDLKSRNGTSVNGKPVSGIDLRSGDEIVAGQSRWRVALSWDGEKYTGDNGRSPTISEGHEGTPPYGQPATMTPTGYRMERELGRGTMGVVYAAIRLADGVRVAIKTIMPAVAAGPAHVQRFKREADILCQIRHPHIVAFHEVGVEGSNLYFAMDYVDGIDADLFLRRRWPLQVSEATNLMVQTLEGLHHAHELGFVHRDIKPSNLIITTVEGRPFVKIADFGLARTYHDSRLSGLTLQGEMGGTPAFMPPEQVTNFRHVKPAADQYSAAATLYRLLTREYIFPNDTLKGPLIQHILHEPPVPISERRPEIPVPLAAAIHRALAKSPEDRFRSCAEFRAALLPYAVRG